MTMGFKLRALQLMIITATLGLAFHAAAEIRTANTLEEALADVRSGDVVVLDIDNTILEPTQTLGTDQWVDHWIERYKQQGADPAHALELALVDWRRVQAVTNVRPVESSTARLIRTLQMSQIPTVALTARPEDVGAITIRQLSSLGVSFPRHAIARTADMKYAYTDGVLFANGGNKGVILKDFLARAGLHPQRVIFVDDKAKNVANMDAEFANGPVINVNFRYGGADARVHSYADVTAATEWMYFERFGVLLSDEDVAPRAQAAP